LSVRGPAGPQGVAYAARTSTEARIQVTETDDRGVRQWDTGSPPFGCWRERL